MGDDEAMRICKVSSRVILASAAVLISVLLSGPAASAASGKAYYRDVENLRRYTSGLDSVLGMVEEQGGIFDPSRTRNFDVSESDALYTAWAAYLDYMIAMEAITERHKDFYLRGDGDRRDDEFLLAYASYLAKISAGLRLIHSASRDVYRGGALDRGHGRVLRDTIA